MPSPQSILHVLVNNLLKQPTKRIRSNPSKLPVRHPKTQLTSMVATTIITSARMPCHTMILTVPVPSRSENQTRCTIVVTPVISTRFSVPTIYSISQFGHLLISAIPIFSRICGVLLLVQGTLTRLRST